MSLPPDRRRPLPPMLVDGLRRMRAIVDSDVHPVPPRGPEEEGRARRERALLLDLLRLPSQTDDLERLIQVATERIVEVLELVELRVYLSDGPETFTVAASHDAPGRPAATGRRLAASASIFEAVGRQLSPVYGDHDALEAVGIGGAEMPPIYGWGAAFPMVREGRMIGLLTVARAPKVSPSEETLELLEAFATQLSVAVHQRRLIDQLRALSNHDELTGLANRRLLTDRLRTEAFRADRFGHETSVLAIDVDHFKALNDRHGHPAGDAALKAIAEAMLESVRRVDLVARTGGEEFVVVLPRTGVAQARVVAEKLRRRIGETRPKGARSQPEGRITVSIGIASFDGQHPDPVALLEAADRGLYEAKRLGRDRIESDPRSERPSTPRAG